MVNNRSPHDGDRIPGDALAAAARADDTEPPVVGEPEIDAEATDTVDLGRNVNLPNIVLAVLFAADEPVSIRKLSSAVEDATGDEVREAVEAWQKRFDEDSWSIRIEKVAGGYQLSTRPDYASYVGRFYSGKRKFRLSRAGMEVLAVIAYKQPVTRADIEGVRGVGSGGVIANLMERSLIKITGKAKVLGAPFLYGTTDEFLEYLGLNALKDLPSLEELESLLEKEAYPELAMGAGNDADEADNPSNSDEMDEADSEEIRADFAEAVAALEKARHVADRVKTGASASVDHSVNADELYETGSEEEQIPTIEFAQQNARSASTEAEADEPTEDDDSTG